MKSIKDLREQYNLITEKEEAETKKLTALVRAGLFDAKKLTSLKRALDKPVDKMTAQEKRMLLNLLDALMSEVLSNQTVYQKVKQNVMKEAVVVDTKDYYAKPDPRVRRVGYPSQKEAPSVLLLKRKAIRVFPDGQKVALYYAQAIDKYVSIPYNEIGISINETLGNFVSGVADSLSSNNSSSSTEDNYSKPLDREKIKLKLSSDDEKPNILSGVEARTQKAVRDANYAMAKGVRENFRSNLESLDEAGAPRPPKGYVAPKIRPKAGIGPGGKSAPEKSTWEKLTDIKDDGTLTGMGKDLMPVVGTVRQAKRTGAAYKQTASDFEKGNYWDAAKGAADTALQGGLTAVSGIGDVLTATGIAAPAVTGIRGAVSAAKAARTASKVNKFIATSKTVPVKTSPALPAPETKPVKPAQTAAERKSKYSMDLEVQRETNRRASEAMRKAAEFRVKYPKSKDTSVSTAAREPKEFKPQISTKAKEPKEVKPSVSVAAREPVAAKPAKVSVKEKEPIDFKLAEPAKSKGELVPFKAKEPKEVRPSVSTTAKEPSDLKYNKSTVGKFPELQKDSKTDTDAKSSTSVQYKQNTQTQSQPKTQKSDKSKTKTDEKDRVPKERKGSSLPFLLPGLPSVGAKDLNVLSPKLKLSISEPRRVGDADAIRSRMASYERKVWQSQAKEMTESVEINLNGNRFVLNNEEANKVISLYESLNTKNKQKMIKMMNESEEQLNKIVSFAVRQ